jgi:hypothetical protein
LAQGLRGTRTSFPFPTGVSQIAECRTWCLVYENRYSSC